MLGKKPNSKQRKDLFKKCAFKMLMKLTTGCILELDMLNLVKLAHGGLVLGASNF
jgi:hypothetical protein